MSQPRVLYTGTLSVRKDADEEWAVLTARISLQVSELYTGILLWILIMESHAFRAGRGPPCARTRRINAACPPLLVHVSAHTHSQASYTNTHMHVQTHHTHSLTHTHTSVTHTLVQ